MLILVATLIPNYRTDKDRTYAIRVSPFGQEFKQLARLVDQPTSPIKPTRIVRLLSDSISNLILFTPFGMILNTMLGQRQIRRGHRFWLVLGLALCLSVTVETLQFYSATRQSDIDDVITNSLGALMGAILATRIHAGMVGVIFMPIRFRYAYHINRYVRQASPAS